MSSSFQLPIEELDQLEREGFFEHIQKENGELNFKDDNLPELSQLLLLKQLGFTLCELKQYVQASQSNEQGKDLQKQMLMKQRCIILENLHILQKQIDQIDYLIHELTLKNKVL